MKTLGLLIAIVFSQLFFGCTNTESIQSNDENFGLEGIELRIEDSLNYQEIGFDYAMKTKGALGKVLMGAIKNKGTVHAVERCNISACR